MFESGKTIVMKKYLVLLVVLVGVAGVARAQTGCDDSPENPTLILAGLAGGAYAVSSLRTRWGARRK